VSGRVWKFSDGISTDNIAPGRYFHLRTNLPELAKHCLEDARQDFVSNVTEGDFVVAGKNFGMGSSREHAPIIIKMTGIRAIIAKSFARIFFRNCINIGLPAVLLDTDEIAEGDQLEIDLSRGEVFDHTTAKHLKFPPLSSEMTSILQEGGLIPFVKKYGDLRF
jgi:3-isopropylmalate/(R)-2-methylmalate dehydratase small subunit